MQHTTEPPYRVTADLPYSLRLVGGPYMITMEMGNAELSFETIRQSRFDERLSITGGEFDFQNDRHGWASYSRVSGGIVPNASAHPVAVLLECLNQLIRHLRDVAGFYWLYDLEEPDLFRMSLSYGLERKEVRSLGRVGGMTLPVASLTSDIEEGLRRRLNDRERVLEWRLLQLAAEDAFALGRYEQAVLLGWSSLEVACRTETPRLASAAGVSTVELHERIYGQKPKNTPFSPEEVAERAHILNLVRVCGELAGTGYDSGSLAQSARNAQNLRNVIIHRGIRLSGSQARHALDAIGFVLNVLRLPTSRPRKPFDYKSWTEHFGVASVDFPQLLDANEGRLVVVRNSEKQPDPLTYWFQLEKANNLFVVRIPDQIGEQVAAVLTVVTNDSYQYGQDRFPYLKVKSAPLITGLLDEAAETTTGAVHWAYASMIRAKAGLPVQDACDYAVDSIWKGFTSLAHTISAGDARFVPISSRIASYLVNASVPAFQRFWQKMAGTHKQLSDKALEMKEVLAVMDPDDPHSICRTLRTIHGKTLWLDSIVVRCPLELAEYGSRRRELQR